MEVAQAPAADGRFVVQVGAFADPAKARDTRQRVERAGLKTYTHVAETKDGKRTRVRVGPFASRPRRQGRREDQGAGFAGRDPHLVGWGAPMATLDWVFLAVLLASLLLGAWRGLVYEVLSLLSWIGAFVAAQWLAPLVAGWLPMGGAGEPVRYAAAFVVVFIAAVFAGPVGGAERKLVHAAGLRPVDRTLAAPSGWSWHGV